MNIDSTVKEEERRTLKVQKGIKVEDSIIVELVKGEQKKEETTDSSVSEEESPPPKV